MKLEEEVVKKLKAKKTYFFKVRAYITKNGKIDRKLLLENYIGGENA